MLEELIVHSALKSRRMNVDAFEPMLESIRKVHCRPDFRA